MNNKVRIIPLGGLTNVTKNMYAYEYWDEDSVRDIILVDCGVGFLSRLEYLGVDFTIPDVTYLKGKEHLIRALLITHGHDDHIGAVPYIVPQLKFPPIFAPKLAALLISAKLQDMNIPPVKITPIKYRYNYTFGAFTVRFIHMTHSIPDTTHLFIKTPIGNLYHGSDFKMDLTPVYGNPPDFQEITSASAQGVKLLLSDGLGAEREGYTLSEKTVGKTFHEEMGQTKGKFFMTTFASNISRIKQCIEAAVSHKRKICFIGRSMQRNMEIALEEHYIKLDRSHIITDRQINRTLPHKVCIILTGSQGEFSSAMEKIASGRHKTVKLHPDDRVLFSSDPIPGNETYVQDVMESIIEQGAEVVYTAIRDELHASGHGSQGDLKLLARLVNPYAVMPIGTTVKHSKAYANLMKELGYEGNRSFTLHTAEPLVIEKDRMYKDTPIPSKDILVDGGSIGDVGETILSERQNLGHEGVVVIVISGKQVQIISKGFIFYERDLFKKIEESVRGIMAKTSNPQTLKERIAAQVQGLITSAVKRSPEIIPVIAE